MVGFYEAYKPIFEAVQSQISSKSTVKTVILGEKFSLGSYPKAVINAEPSDDIKPNTFGQTLEVPVRFSVILIVREYEPEDWFDDIIKVMCDVVDAVLADRTMSGHVKDCLLAGFAPGEIKFQDKLLYGGSIRFKAVLLYEP
jgi:hypothetical protein